MNMEINVCGHCGTEVRGGYTVCPGCGAVYARRVGRAVRGVVCVVIGGLAALFGLLEMFFGARSYEFTNVAILLGGILAVYMGRKHFRDGWTKAWWRET